MRLASIAFAFFIASKYLADPQVSNDRLLRAFINDDIFCNRILSSCDKNCDSIFIIDTAKLFSSTIKIEFSKTIVLEHELKKVPPPTTAKEYPIWSCRVVIRSIVRDKNSYTINFSNPASKISGFVTYIYHNKKLTKKKFAVGQS